MVFQNGFVYSSSYLTRYLGNDPVIEIPEGTTKIEAQAFKGKDTEELYIPEGVTEICDEAFSGCKRLRRVSFPKSLEKIGADAFGGCIQLKEVHVGSNIKCISKRAFLNCLALEKVSIEGREFVIGDMVFFNCRSLREISISEGLIYLGSCAFTRCELLKEIVLPDTLIVMGSEVFAHCHSLERFTVPGGIRVLRRETFSDCIALEKINIHDQVQEILDGCFLGCEALREISARGVNFIKGFPFGENVRVFLPSLSLSLNINKSIKYILLESFLKSRELYTEQQAAAYIRYAFSRRRYILEHAFKTDKAIFVEFYRDMGKITKHNVDGEYIEPALELKAHECFAVASEWKNANVTVAASIDDEFDLDSSKPMTVAQMKQIWSYETYSDGSAKINGYKGTQTCVTVPSVIGRKVVDRIGNYAFSPSNGSYTERVRNARRKITLVIIPEGVSKIGDSAFAGCKSLTEIRFPQSLRCVGLSAFSFCDSLENIELPDGVRELDSFAFSSLTAVKSLRIPSGVRYLGDAVISFNDKLEQVIISQGVEKIGSSILFCGKLSYVEIPESVKEIDDGLFGGLNPFTVIGGRKNSCAEAFAKKHNLTFREI